MLGRTLRNVIFWFFPCGGLHSEACPAVRSNSPSRRVRKPLGPSAWRKTWSNFFTIGSTRAAFSAVEIIHFAWILSMRERDDSRFLSPARLPLDMKRPASSCSIPPSGPCDSLRFEKMSTLTFPHSLPSPAEDSEQLHKAFQGSTLHSSFRLIPAKQGQLWLPILIDPIRVHLQDGAPTRAWSSPSSPTALPATAARSVARTLRSTVKTYLSRSKRNLHGTSRLACLRTLFHSPLRHSFPSLSLFSVMGFYSVRWQRAVMLWVLDPAERDAMLANEAAMKWSPGNRVLIEIAVARTADELFAARRSYQSRFKRSLEEDVSAHTHGDFRKVNSLFWFALLFLLDSSYSCLLI